jgi:hypothetical protein
VASVILWWGTDLRVLGPAGTLVSQSLTEKEDPVQAIIALVTGAHPTAEAARIAYHPASIEMHDVSCPVAGRARLHRQFSRDHPSLRAAGTLWAVDSPGGRADGSGTVLYIDASPDLARLVDGLARKGIRTEGAWPLPCLVESADPACHSGKPSWAVVAIPGRALVASLGPDGGRFVRHHEGVGAVEDALADLNTALALAEGGEAKPGICAAEDGGGVEALHRFLGGCKVTTITLDRLLERARFLIPGGASDFLARRPRLPPKRVFTSLAAGLGILLVAGSAWSARSTWATREGIRRSEAEARGLRAQLRATIEARQAIKDEILRKEQALGQLQIARQREYDLLMALSGCIPKQVELLEISTQSGSFAIRGRCEAGATGAGAILSQFRRDLGFKGAPWILAEEPSDPPGSEFVWHGSFQ